MVPKTIIVTGASRGESRYLAPELPKLSQQRNELANMTSAPGIGWAVAQHLLGAPQSNNLVVLARSGIPLQQLKEQYPGQVEVLSGDLANLALGQEAVSLAINTFGQLDGLVINHGILGPVARLENSDLEEWKGGFDVNFFSAVGLVKAAIPYLRESKGRIIFTSSGAAISGSTGWGLYGSTKAAMNHLNMTVACEESEITSVSIRPGMVDTQMQKDLRSQHLGVIGARFVNAYKEGKLVQPEQPGHVIAKLVLDAPHELSGKFLTWNAGELAAFQE